MGAGPSYADTPLGEFPASFTFITSIADESERWSVLKAVSQAIARKQEVIDWFQDIEWYRSDSWDRMVFGRMPNGKAFEFRLERQRESMCGADRFSDWHQIEDAPRRHDYIEYEARVVPLRPFSAGT